MLLIMSHPYIHYIIHLHITVYSAQCTVTRGTLIVVAHSRKRCERSVNNLCIVISYTYTVGRLGGCGVASHQASQTRQNLRGVAEGLPKFDKGGGGLQYFF